jgi:hypothetical protein
MTQFKYTTENNKIIHITSSPGNIVIEEPGVWSEMTDEEYENFMQSENEQMEILPTVDVEPLTAQQKLESLGLTVDDLKELLNI